jgi:hypothetical protein
VKFRLGGGASSTNPRSAARLTPDARPRRPPPRVLRSNFYHMQARYAQRPALARHRTTARAGAVLAGGRPSTASGSRLIIIPPSGTQGRSSKHPDALMRTTTARAVNISRFRAGFTSYVVTIIEIYSVKPGSMRHRTAAARATRRRRRASAAAGARRTARPSARAPTRAARSTATCSTSPGSPFPSVV